MNRYRATCLTPTLLGSGERLSPIDYMVWRDQVNVLDQYKIFSRLSGGPRLDGYLQQLKRADRLDFQNWGGFAQGYAVRRIPFEDASLIPVMERTPSDQLFIPTPAAQAGRIYLPATVLKGAIRAALTLDRAQDGHWKQLAQQMTSDRPPRRPGDALESAVLGGGARTRSLLISDSSPLAFTSTKVYLLRPASLVERGGRIQLGWKTASRGTVDGQRVSDAATCFAEMATPGTQFEGAWNDRRLSSGRGVSGYRALLESINRAAARWLDSHAEWAELSGLAGVGVTARKLKERLAEVQASGTSCLLCAGWGTGLVPKAAFAGKPEGPVAEALDAARAFLPQRRTRFPLPKTRNVLFLRNYPTSLPGWIQIDLIS